MADALSKIQAGVDKARTKLAANRLGGREFCVSLRNKIIIGTEADIGAVPEAGIPGDLTDQIIEITPTPKVVLKPAYRYVDGGVDKIGDAIVSGISRVNYTEDDLLSAEDWLIDGDVFTLVKGHLEIRPTEFRAVLVRREG